MRHRLLATALLVLAPWCSTRAGIFDDEQARFEISELKKQVAAEQARIDAQLAKLESALRGQGMLDLLSQVEAIKADLSKLRGQIEVLTFEAEQAKKRQQDFYTDLDSRLRKLEEAPKVVAAVATPPAAAAPAPGAAAASAQPSAAATPPPSEAAAPALSPTQPATTPATHPTPPSAQAPDELKQYELALDRLQAGEYSAAITELQAFLSVFPDGKLAPNAQYWVGYAYYALKDHKNAITNLEKVWRQWPNSDKAPDAMLTAGTSQQAMGNTRLARRSYEAVIARYKGTPAAQAARQRLAAVR
jgi:tol-pal system protein YbgF